MAIKKCKGCGEEISPSEEKCPKCGKEQKSFSMKHLILCIVIILIVVIAVVVLVRINSNRNTDNRSETKTNLEYTQDQKTIGDTISNGRYEITVSNVEQLQKVGFQYLNSKPAEGNIYVCVDFNYKNISNEIINDWDFPRLKLVNEKGVEYSSDISASSYYAEEKEPNREKLTELNPEATINDNKVFEVSKEDYNKGEWFIVVDKDIIIKIK